MKTLIVFTTTHGCTEACATKLRHQLKSDAEVINIKKKKPGNLSDYETIIIGGSIHAGKIQKKIKKFCQENLEILKQKKLGLFLCCMEVGEQAQKQFQDAFPGELIDHASATGFFGGEFNFDKMNFIEKAIIKKVAKIEKSVSKIDETNIVEFAQKIQV